MMKQKTTNNHCTLYHLTLVYHIIALLLIGADFFIIHQLPYVIEHQFIRLAIDIVVLGTIVGLAWYGLRRVKRKKSLFWKPQSGTNRSTTTTRIRLFLLV